VRVETCLKLVACKEVVCWISCVIYCYSLRRFPCNNLWVIPAYWQAVARVNGLTQRQCIVRFCASLWK